MDKKATILVVDDEYGVRQSFNMVLKGKYNVLLAGTGEEAIEVFTKNSVDLILLDILLPWISKKRSGMSRMPSLRNINHIKPLIGLGRQFKPSNRT